MSSTIFGRRHILKLGLTALSGAAGASLLGRAAQAQTQTAAPSTAAALKEACGIEAAEMVMGVTYTDAERATLYDGLDDQLDTIRARRTMAPLDYDDTPALTFNPRLPGRDYPAQKSEKIYPSYSSKLPASPVDIAFAPALEQSHWLKSGQITSRKLTEIYLERIARLNPKLECFITVTDTLALKEADKADAERAAGRDRGPLHGLPYGVKDLADTKGIASTWGAAPFKDRVGTVDAAIVTRLRKAGAVLLGKTSLGALAYNDVWWGGTTRNPWALTEGSSGSSAGSASATAAGLVSFSIGSETLGSIVSPSTRCGTTGLRPTFGRVPRSGAMPLCWSLDKLGPITRGVYDTGAVLAALNGADAGDPASLDFGLSINAATKPESLRVGYHAAWFENASPLDTAALDWLKDAGVTLVDVGPLPDMPYGALVTNLLSEAAAAFEDLTLTNKDDLMMWQEPNAWPNGFREARFNSAVEFVQIDRLRRKVMVMMDDLMRTNKLNALISPNFAAGLLTITNYTGHPSLTVPIGLRRRQTLPLTNTKASPGPEADLPHTITLWGNMFEEGSLLSLGKVIESAASYSKNRPEVAAV